MKNKVILAINENSNNEEIISALDNNTNISVIGVPLVFLSNSFDVEDMMQSAEKFNLLKDSLTDEQRDLLDSHFIKNVVKIITFNPNLNKNITRLELTKKIKDLLDYIALNIIKEVKEAVVEFKDDVNYLTINYNGKFDASEIEKIKRQNTVLIKSVEKEEVNKIIFALDI